MLLVSLMQVRQMVGNSVNFHYIYLFLFSFIERQSAKSDNLDKGIPI